MMYGKMTKFKDSNDRLVYEFDRIAKISDGTKASVIFRDYPNFAGVIPYALKDDGSFMPLQDFGFFNVVDGEESDQAFCRKYDYRREML